MRFSQKNNGIVYLVGAGPGDAGLITLRGVELLKRAEVVIYDGLVNQRLLEFVDSKAEVIYGGRFDRAHSLPQVELNALLVNRALEGKRVVRLKGGDSYIFGRGGEEAECLAEAGIPFEVVPGVSSIQAAAGCAGIPLTHRGFNSSFTVFSGHEPPFSPESKIDWALMAQIQGTLVVMMGLKNLREIAATLIRNGKSAATPAAVVSRGTLACQRSVSGTLANIADLADQSRLEAPGIIVIGEVVRLREKLNWFENRLLFGQRIVVTQRLDLARPSLARFAELGAEVLHIPATHWIMPPGHDRLDQLIRDAGAFDWVLFSNPNAVDFFFTRFMQTHGDVRALGSVRLGAYGPQTGERMRCWSVRPAAVAADHKLPLIMEVITRCGNVNGLKFLLFRGGSSTENVPEALTALGATVEVAPGYVVEPDPDDASGDAARFVKSGADWIVFASALAIEHFHHRFNLPEMIRRFPEMRISITTPDIQYALDNLGLKSDVVSQTNDWD